MNTTSFPVYNRQTIPLTQKPKFKILAFGSGARLEKLAIVPPDMSCPVVNQFTYFFRNLDVLLSAKRLIESHFARKKVVNYFDGACSTGDSTWSAKIILNNDKIKFVGFDLGKAAVEKASSGYFSLNPNKAMSDGKPKSNIADLLSSINEHKLVKNNPVYRELLNKFFTLVDPKEYVVVKAKDKFKNLCTFIQGDILELNKFIPKGGADVISFMNALYHITSSSQEGILLKPRTHQEIKPLLKKCFNGINEALSEKGFFILGTFPVDHIGSTGKLIYKQLGQSGFEPVSFHDPGKASIWQKVSSVSAQA
jgi:chemotaxis methyl-accepting protein methylase